MSPTCGFYHCKAQGEFIMNLNVCSSQGIQGEENFTYEWAHKDPSIKEGCLFVCHIQISQTTMPSSHSSYSLGSPPWVRVHQGCLITFKTKMQELMNIEQFCHWKFHKIKTENFIKLWKHFSFFGKCLISKILWMVFYYF